MNKPTRKLQKEQTRRLLLDTAYSCFADRGITSTRMSDIAQAAGVSHGTVFLHFQSQEALITEVIRRCCGEIARRTNELAQGSTTLRALLAAHLAGIREYEPFYTRLVIENRFLQTAARDAWLGVQSAVSFHFFEAAKREVPAVAPALLFNLWIGLVHHYLANGDLFAPGESVIDRCGGTMLTAFLTLTGAHGGTHPENES